MNPCSRAYRACHSTETALVRVQNDILHTLDQDVAAILVLLDLSAAFNTIDHSILLSRMESFLGVIGSALQWFKSYLPGRKQRIKINDDFSENQEILWSVPQGSVLGALLFLIYIVPLAQLIRSYGLSMVMPMTPSSAYHLKRQVITQLSNVKSEILRSVCVTLVSGCPRTS